jgi:RimJ/RimL family protein N-acetyltransferase
MQHTVIQNQPSIKADGFYLRPLIRSDGGDLSLYAGDSRVAKMTSSIPHPLPPGAIEAFLERAAHPERVEDIWALDASEAGGASLMGLISLKRLERKQSEIGYWIAPHYWGTGLASRAVNALVATNPMHDRTMFAAVFQDNPASAKVLTQAGFDYIGDAETFSIARDALVPTWTYLRRFDP